HRLPARSRLSPGRAFVVARSGLAGSAALRLPTPTPAQDSHPVRLRLRPYDPALRPSMPSVIPPSRMAEQENPDKPGLRAAPPAVVQISIENQSGLAADTR